MKEIIKIVLILLSVKIIVITSLCYDSRIKSKTVTEPYIQTYTTTVSKSCGFLWLKTCFHDELRSYRSSRTVQKTYWATVKVCCSGYTNYGYDEDDLDCRPNCSPPCRNGNCVEPNKCQCISGYHKGNQSHICEPTCQSGCQNGYCKSPGKCECNDGYTEVDHKCTPDCKQTCDHGTCVAPMKCNCYTGYERINEKCIPICQNNCGSHGSCVGPDDCICDTGYAYNKTDLLCVPQCPEGCEDGNCVRPNECVCENGYNYTEGKCGPICQNNCGFHGSCIAPDDCECDISYTYNKTNFLCLPQCPEGCENGNCVRPNECVCEDGHYYTEGKCKPICQNDCGSHGSCIAPDDCHCDTGYAYNKSSLLCLSQCPKGCENGNCVRPNECVCEDGHHYTEGKCKPICQNDCGSHGSCIAPDDCHCDTGYAYNKSSLLCLPQCPKGCENGNCVRPNECVCEDGHYYTEGKCKPICQNDCGSHGSCIAPDDCHCDTGYAFNKSSLLCLPQCPKGCENGNCVRPNECVCEDGYNYIEGMCEPLCDLGCINGSCVLPNTCQCYPGYEKAASEIQNHICKPICRGCHYGYCNEPYLCICYDGYEYNSSLNNDVDDNSAYITSTARLDDDYEEICIKINELEDGSISGSTTDTNTFETTMSVLSNGVKFEEDVTMTTSDMELDKDVNVVLTSSTKKGVSIPLWIPVAFIFAIVLLAISLVVSKKYGLFSKGVYFIKDINAQDSDHFEVKFSATEICKTQDDASNIVND